jgi:MFS transporter, DHA1 family, multidrug resistance protein
MGWLADRVNRKIMMVLGGLIVSGAVYAFTLATGFWHMFFASVTFGLGGGIAMPPMMAAAVLWGSRNHAMGSVMAIVTVGHSLGMLVGSLLAGAMMQWFELRQAFGLGALTMAAGIVVFLICTWRADLSSGTVRPAHTDIAEG